MINFFLLLILAIVRDITKSGDQHFEKCMIYLLKF